MNKSTKTAIAGLAGAGLYLAASAIGGRHIRLGSLLAVATLGTARMVAPAVTASQALAKAYAAHGRIDDMIQNGFSTAGDMYVVGGHHTGTLYVNGHQIKSNVSGANQGLSGAPGTYDAVWCSNLSQCVSDLRDLCHTAGIRS